MTETVWVAMIGAGGALLGAVVSGLFTWLAGRSSRSLDRLEQRLRVALQDVLSLRELEELYTRQLADAEGSSVEAVKRRTWEQCARKPSARSEPARVRRELEEELG
jgi:hypothetical protein